jgi:hypothetical protein
VKVERCADHPRAGTERLAAAMVAFAQPTAPRSVASPVPFTKEMTMRGALLWFLGIPIPIIIALYLFGVL